MVRMGHRGFTGVGKAKVRVCPNSTWAPLYLPMKSPPRSCASMALSKQQVGAEPLFCLAFWDHGCACIGGGGTGVPSGIPPFYSKQHVLEVNWIVLVGVCPYKGLTMAQNEVWPHCLQGPSRIMEKGIFS